MSVCKRCNGWLGNHVETPEHSSLEKCVAALGHKVRSLFEELELLIDKVYGLDE